MATKKKNFTKERREAILRTNLKTANDMISIKLKFRPSMITGKEGSLYYQVIYKRVIRQVLTEYKILTDEWNSDKGCLILNTVDIARYDYLSLIQQNIEWDNRRFQHIIRRLSSSNLQFNADTVVQEFQNKSSDITLFNRMQNHCCPEKFYHKVGCSTEPASGTLTGVVG